MSKDPSSESDDWCVPCSDDEINGDNEWSPPASELEALYSEIEKKGTLTLEYKCLGRRAPSPATRDEVSNHSDAGSTTEEKGNNFEFMDEMSSPQMRVRGGENCELKGSAKKQTSSLDGILSNIRRHQKLSRIDRDNQAN